MTPTTCEQLAKQDSRERIRYGRDRREELLGEFERSGMSAAGFAFVTQRFGIAHQKRGLHDKIRTKTFHSLRLYAKLFS